MIIRILITIIKFYLILVEPLQARELTQLQTMIYQEMGRFGGNIFKEGSAVSFGGVGINSFYDYVQIATIVNGVFSDIPVGTIFTNDNGVKS